MEIEELERQIAATRQKIDRSIGEATSIAKQGIQLKTDIEKYSAEVELLEKATALLANLGEEKQQSTQLKIEQLVTQGLQKIFGPELSFHVVNSVSKKTPTVDFVVRTTLEDGERLETGVLDARGGGIAAVVGFLLRLVILLLSRDKEPLLVLDETFAAVSESYRPAVAEFLKEITEKSDIQLILVTHEPIFTEAADKVYNFSLDRNGFTKVKEL